MRRQETIDEIVAEAWELSRANGLANFSMRELGTRVGMRAQSLYSYFGSKLEICDAMFLDGNRRLLETMRAETDGFDITADPTGTIEATARGFLRFCTSDPVRYQLLFQRTIPDFVPSPDSFAVAQEAFDLAIAPLRAQGIDDQGVDLFTAVLAGLAAQQISNDPGGDRWERVIPSAITMLLRELCPNLYPTPPSTRSQP